MSRDIFKSIRSLRDSSSLALNVPMDGPSTISEVLITTARTDIWNHVKSQGEKKICLQMLHDFLGIQPFPPGTNPREMQLTGFICGWFSPWQLVISLQAEAEASVSLFHVVCHCCDSAQTWFQFCLCFQKLSVLCWLVLQETFVPPGNIRIPVSSFSSSLKLHPWGFLGRLACLCTF